MPTNQEALDQIKARFPKNRQHDVQAAYELGLNELDAKLATKPRPAGTSPAGMPPLQKSILYHALLTKVQCMQIPGHRYDLAREEKYRMGSIQTQTEANLGYLLGLLPKYLKIGHVDGSLSPAAAVQEYFDNFSTILWEAMDAVLSCDDPVKAVTILRLLQTEGMDSIQLAPDPEPELKIAS